ncbi:MAG: TolC family protein [Bacteriovoracaceae bacterium]
MHLIFILLTLVLTPSYAAITLKDAFQSARLNMESLKRAEHEIERRRAVKDQAQGVVLPTVNGVGSYLRIDPPSGARVNSAFTLTRQYNYAIRMQQPLIRGGVYEALQMRKEDVLLAEFQKNATELSLYQLVIAAYYNLYNARIDLKSLEEFIKISQDRVKELRSRASVGRSRKGELVQAEAQLLTAEAQLQQGKVNLEQAENNFEFYTKIKPDDLADFGDLPSELPSLAEFQEKIKSRPDVLASRQAVNVADRQIGVSKGGHYPSLDLIGNYYLDRTGVLASSKWDVGVQVTVPFFQGGTVESQVRQSVEAKRIAELNSSETLRTAQRDTSILYQNYLQIYAELKTLKQALEKAEQSYKLNIQDYRYGQVTNLDVIQSLNLYIETKRAFNNLFAMAHMTYKNLEASIGVLP